MKIYLVNLKDSDYNIGFLNQEDAKRFIRKIDFYDRFTVSESNDKINIQNRETFKHKIDVLEVTPKNVNFIYSSVCMKLESKNYEKYGLKMYPILDLEERLVRIPDRAYYSIVRKDSNNKLKSKTEVYINEQEGYIKVELYIPIGKYTEYITKSSIIERLNKQICKYRNIYFSNKYGKLKNFKNQYNQLTEDLREYLFLKGYKRPIIETCLKLVEYSKERNKSFSKENRINSIKKLIEQIKEIESKGLLILSFKLVRDLIREGNKNDNG